MRFLALFLLVIAYKFLANLMHYFRIKKLQTYFSEFLDHKRSDMNFYRQEVLSLFEKAHVKDIKIPASEHIGNGEIETDKTQEPFDEPQTGDLLKRVN